MTVYAALLQAQDFSTFKEAAKAAKQAQKERKWKETVSCWEKALDLAT